MIGEKLSAIKDQLSPLNVGSQGNLLLNEEEICVYGHAISSEVKDMSGVTYILARWKGKGFEPGIEPFKEGKWLSVKTINPTLLEGVYPDDVVSGKGLVVADSSSHEYYIGPIMVEKIVGLLPHDIYKQITSG